MILVKNFRYILTNRDITKNVTKSLDVINQAINNFGEPLKDLIDSRELNTIDDVFDYDEIDKSAWNEFWSKTIPESADNSGNETEIYNGNVSNNYYFPEFYSTFKRFLPHISLWSKILHGNLNRYDKEHGTILPGIIAEKNLSRCEPTNSHAELYMKKATKDCMNMYLSRYIEYTNTFRSSLQRQFVDQFCHKKYKKKYIPKRTYPKLEKDFLLNEKDIKQDGDKNNIEQEMWSRKTTPKKPSKYQKNSFLKNPSKPIDFKDSVRKRKTKKDQTNGTSRKKKSPQIQTKIYFTKCKNEDLKAKKNIKSLTENLKDVETGLNQLKKDYDQLGFQMFKNIEKEDLLKTNKGDASKAKAQADETWQTLTVQEKDQFSLMVPIRDKSVCFCSENNGNSMAACDCCNCWYHNECLGFEHGFTHAMLTKYV